MYVEPEVSTLVLILYLACKSYQSHLQKTVASQMILFCYPNIPDIVWKQWYMENSTDKSDLDFVSGLYIVAMSLERHDDLID